LPESPTRSDLLLTIPVESIVAVALRELDQVKGLDRDEAYLLARLEEVDEQDRTTALLQAIKDAPSDNGSRLYDLNEISAAVRCAEKSMEAHSIVTPWAAISHLEGHCGCEEPGGDPKTASMETAGVDFSESVRIPDQGCTHASHA
jgi:hypothetical protein